MRISSAAILIIICISLTSGVVSWFIMSKKSRIGNYLTAKVIRGNIENTVTAVGVLQPFYYVDVGAQVTGQLKTLKVKAGDSVKKGQLLAEIDPIIFQAKVLEASATLENLKAQLKVKERSSFSPGNNMPETVTSSRRMPLPQRISRQQRHP